MKIVVDNKIHIFDAPELLNDEWFKSRLSVDNPDYFKKVQMGKWTGNTPRKINLFERNALELILPFGLWTPTLLKKIKKYDDYEVVNKIKPIRAFEYGSSINLYDYQEKAVNEALKRKNGVVVMPCGSGKTQTALELISRIGGRALWLTHTQDLLNQSYNRALSVLDAPKNSYGKITGGNVSIGEGVTFATVQTMAKIDLTDLKYAFDVIVVDECHKAVGSPTKVMQFYRVLSSLCCRYKFGLTATPNRNDGLEKSMFALLGEVVFEVPKDAVKDTTCKVKVKFVDTGYMPEKMSCVLASDGTLNYAKLVDDLTHNENRFRVVTRTINGLPNNEPKIVLANRVEYLERLEKAFDGKSICLSSLGKSKKSKQIRKDALKKLNDGDLDCIFATYQLAKEGLDVPNLRYVVFSTPEKDKITVTQSGGRVGRKAEGKEFGIIIDFADSFGMFKGWTTKRKNIYKKLKYEVEDGVI